jgi:hypothetical protein
MLFFLLYVLILLHFIIHLLFLFLPQDDYAEAVLGILSSGESTHFPGLTHTKLGNAMMHCINYIMLTAESKECIRASTE